MLGTSQRITKKLEYPSGPITTEFFHRHLISLQKQSEMSQVKDVCTLEDETLLCYSMLLMLPYRFKKRNIEIKGLTGARRH